VGRDRCTGGKCTPPLVSARPRVQNGSDVATGGNQRRQTMLRNESTLSGRKLFQRVTGGTRVSISTTGTCSNPRALAQALPGAHAMVDTAVNWFISVNPRDVARVNTLLQANFMSASDEVRSSVESRLLRMRDVLAAAQSGNFTFNCVPGTNPDCQGNNGFVMTNDRSVIHLCPSFFDLTAEGRRWTLVHESAHVAGAVVSPEFYYGQFGPIGDAQCRSETPSISTSTALGHADNYARLVWCLTRPAGREVTPP
jgi:hypothetical protein